METRGNNHLIKMVRNYQNKITENKEIKKEFNYFITDEEKEILNKVKSKFKPRLLGFILNKNEGLYKEYVFKKEIILDEVLNIIEEKIYLLTEDSLLDLYELSDSTSSGNGFKFFIPNHYFGEILINQFLELLEWEREL